MCGWGYSFSMWQMLQMLQMLSKCILSHFATDFSAQKRTFAPKFKNHRACPGTLVVHPDLSGRPRLLKLHPRRNYWAYLPNNLPKNVVPLQRNFKTLQYHESPNIAVKGATQPKEIPPNCSFQLPLLR